MPNDMPSPWRHLNPASARFSTVKGYIRRHNVNDTRTQSWREWAAQKIKLRLGQTDEGPLVTEKITLFPGWATRRYDTDSDAGNDHDGMVKLCIGSLLLTDERNTLDAFGIDVFVSGFATNQRPLEQASRSQRAFIRLAKGTPH